MILLSQVASQTSVHHPVDQGHVLQPAAVVALEEVAPHHPAGVGIGVQADELGPLVRGPDGTRTGARLKSDQALARIFAPVESRQGVWARLQTYGLAGGVWTQDVGRAHRMVRAMKTGMMWVNCYGVTDPSVSYGGTKMSGFGAKRGRRHVEDYLLDKTVWMKLDMPSSTP